MKYAILIYGQFRTFEHNLENNLKAIQESILKNNEICIYIVTDRKGNYSKNNEEKIINIFNKYKCNVKFIKFWEDLQDYHSKETINMNNYDKNCKHVYGKDSFTSNLWYRRFISNKIKNEYCLANKLEYDLHMFIRLFDTTIKQNLKDEIIKDKIEDCIKNNKLLMSIDTIFIGKKSIIDEVFSFGENFQVYHDIIWNNFSLVNYIKLIDWGLYSQENKPTYCSEIQILCHIFYNNIFCENIRFDHCNSSLEENKFTLFHVRLCNKRHN